MEVSVNGYETAIAQGSSKRFAEQASAQKFLIRERVWEDGE